MHCEWQVGTQKSKARELETHVLRLPCALLERDNAVGLADKGQLFRSQQRRRPKVCPQHVTPTSPAVNPRVSFRVCLVLCRDGWSCRGGCCARCEAENECCQGVGRSGHCFGTLGHPLPTRPHNVVQWPRIFGSVGPSEEQSWVAGSGEFTIHILLPRLPLQGPPLRFGTVLVGFGTSNPL